MKCPSCSHFERKNTWKCSECGKRIEGGVVFVTGISGTPSGEFLRNTIKEAGKHSHQVDFHDIGEIMRRFAEEDDPDVVWDRILDSHEKVRRHLRALAFQELGFDMKSNPDTLHVVDLHLCFRWHPYLVKGFEPHVLKEFTPHVRCFINLVEDIQKVQNNLSTTSWGNRKTLELLLWRDEELFLTDLFANICGRVNSFALACGEPSSELEKIIWHPEQKRVYLSFPITSILTDQAAMQEIFSFRDKLREFMIVFDPYAEKDYDDTYKKKEMEAIRHEVGEVTKDRDFRFIDQAEAVVVYFPKKVPSKGVDAEMNHARSTGKPIFLYSPEDLGGGPFAVPATHFRSNPQDYLQLIRQELCK